MRPFLALAVVALATGCTTLNDPDTQLAAADCKIAPITTASATGVRPRPVDRLEQRYAEMQLASTDYRQRQLNQPLGAFGPTEQALRDCQNAR